MTSIGVVSPSKKKSKLKVETNADIEQENPHFNREIELTDPYEDEDFKIYFDKRSLIEYLNFLEEDNLFKIHLVDEDAMQLKNMKLESIQKYKPTEEAIEEVTTSLAILEKSRDLILEKYKYLSSYIQYTGESSV